MSLLILTIQGYHIPAKKNGKMLCRGRLITDPAKQKVMETIVNDLLSQLRSVLATTDAGTSITCCPRCKTALLMPADDCWQSIPYVSAAVEVVGKGMEGCEITIKTYE